jgi:hypothetical protein
MFNIFKRKQKNSYLDRYKEQVKQSIEKGGVFLLPPPTLQSGASKRAEREYYEGYDEAVRLYNAVRKLYD